MGKKGNRYGTDRTRLEEVIPISTPFLLFVDPSSSCNFKCKFCPCGGGNKEVWGKEKKVGILSYEIYRKVIDDLVEFPTQIKTLRLYKEGEPTINKRLPDMISYAKKKNVAKTIDFTTNASLIDHDLALAIIDAGLDRINISIEALDEAGYMRISGVKIDMKNFLENLKFLYENRKQCHIFLKISDLGLGLHTEKEFYDMFSNMCDEISIEHVSPVWPEFELDINDRISAEKDIYGGDMKTRERQQVCPYLFYSMCVNSDGTVSACLMDWNHQLIVGDIKKQSLFEIWNGSAMQNMRIEHLKKNKAIFPTCKNCGQLEYAVLDNIDEYAEELLEKIKYDE